MPQPPDSTPPDEASPEPSPDAAPREPAPAVEGAAPVVVVVPEPVAPAFAPISAEPAAQEAPVVVVVPEPDTVADVEPWPEPEPWPSALAEPVRAAGVVPVRWDTPPVVSEPPAPAAPEVAASPVAAAPPKAHPITAVVSALALLAGEGAALGVGIAQASLGGKLVEYVAKNKLPGDVRRLVVGAFALGLLLFAGAGVVWLVRKRAAGIERLSQVSRRLLPLFLLAFLPTLFYWQAWKDRALSFLVLGALLGLGGQHLFMRALSAPPLFPGLQDRLAGWRARWLAPQVRDKWLPALLVFAAATFYVLYFQHYTVAYHRNVYSRSFDLGLEDNILWQVVNGGPFFYSSPLFGSAEGSHFGYHATWFAYVIGPFYALWPGPETLLTTQAFLLGGAAVPLYFFARHHIGSWPAAIVASLYVLYPPLHGANLYDFHYLPLGPFFIWSTLAFIEAGRTRWAIVAMILTLTVREDVAASLAVVGAYLLLSGDKPKWGLTLAGVAGAYFILIKLVIMPLYKGDQSFTYIYKGLIAQGEKGFGGVLKTVFANPGFTVDTLLDKEKLSYFLQIMVPMAFLPFRRPIGLVLAAPGILFTLLATGYKPVYQTSFQYTAHWTGPMFVGAVAALKFVRAPRDAADVLGEARFRGWLTAFALAMVAASVQFGGIFQTNTIRGGFGPYKFVTGQKELERREAATALVAQIPPDAKVVASEQLNPQVSTRAYAYTLRFGLYDADWVLAELNAGDKERRRLQELAAGKEFGVVDLRPPFVLLKRGHDTSRNAELAKKVGAPPKKAPAKKPAEDDDEPPIR